MSESAELLWIGDPGCRDAPNERRATYVGPAKPFCPCDTGNPQDCKPEEWRPAHAPRPPCERCGNPLYRHRGNYCYRPTPYAPYFDADWVWYALDHDVPWKRQAIDTIRAALARYAAVPGALPKSAATSNIED